MLQTIIQLIREHGDLFYAIAFAWAFFEGETFVLFAGVAAHRGLLRAELIILAAWIGSFCGDQVWFWIGRQYGTRLITRFPKMKPGTQRALGFLERYSTWFILSYRFMYGIRNVSSFAMGMSQLTWKRFSALNFIAAGVWATSFTMAGYYFSNMAGRVLQNAALSFAMSMAGLFLLVIIGRWAISRWAAARARRAALNETTEPLNPAP